MVAAAVVLRFAPTEFVLMVPNGDGPRASKIGGKWIPDRSCWTYQRTRGSFRAILQEFGSEIDWQSFDFEELFSSRGSVRDTAGDATAATTQGSIGAAGDHRKDLTALIERKDAELARLSERIRSLEQELSAAKTEGGSGQAAIRRLEAELDGRDERIRRLETDLIALRRSAQSKDLDATMHEVLRVVFPADANLEPLARGIVRREDLAADMGLRLEVDLRNALPDAGKTSFIDLIRQAAEANLLSEEAIDLAHLVRKQRNRTVHPDSLIMSTSDSIRIARNLVAVAAMKIVLRDLARSSHGTD